MTDVDTLGRDRLVDWLETQPEDRLVMLLRKRPDLASPPPANLSVLAARIKVRVSILRALELLDAFTLHVLDGLLLLTEQQPASYAELLHLMGKSAPEKAVKSAVNRLRSIAVIWGPDEELQPVSTVREVTPPYPAGLGRPIDTLLERCKTAQISPILEALGLPRARQPNAAREVADYFSDPKQIAVLLGRCGRRERGVLQQLAAGPPVGTVRDARRPVRVGSADTPIRWLMVHGLLVAIDTHTVELPREVGLVMRGDRPLGACRATPPEVPSKVIDSSTVDAAAVAQAADTLRLVNAMLVDYGETPPTQLRSSGLSMRDLRRIARILDVPEATAALYLEVAHAAGLLASSDSPTDSESEWLPTEQFDNWARLPAEQRWEHLVRAWLSMPRLPALVGHRSERDRPFPALSNELQRASAAASRRRVLAALAEQPPGHAIVPTDLCTLLAWRAPRRGGQYRDDIVGWTLNEAETLGLAGYGALSSYGRLLLAGEDVSAVLKELLPQSVDHILVQGDLTIVAPGPLQPDLAQEIALLADVESSGAGTVYRVTEATMRRAFDAGRTASDLHALFKERSQTPIPQALTYLIDDLAKRHGDIRVGHATSYLRCHDEELLTRVLAERGLGSLRLRRISPTVVIAPVTPIDLLDALRIQGYAPMAESHQSVMIFEEPIHRRLPTPPTTPNRSSPTPGDAHLVQVARMMRGKERPRREMERRTERPTQAQGIHRNVLTLLQRANREGRPVLLGYIEARGETCELIVEPISVGGGYLRGFDHKRNEVRTFPLHRVSSASILDDDVDFTTR